SSNGGGSAFSSADALLKAACGCSAAGLSIRISNSEISDFCAAADSGTRFSGTASLMALFAAGGACGCAGGADSVAAPCSRSDAHSSDKSTSCTGLLGSEGFGGGGTPEETCAGSGSALGVAGSSCAASSAADGDAALTVGGAGVAGR